MVDLSAYASLLDAKRCAFTPRGMSLDDVDLNASMRPHQEAVTRFLLGAGCGASFLDTGLGKTLIALEWSRVVHRKSGKPVLMLAPLAVGPQHAGEARRFGIDAAYLREPPIGALPPIVITNYERLGAWDLSQFGGVALDESSILKSFAGKVRTRLIETFRDMPYRLASTATPAPNDHMELGNHAEFLGVMASREMLSRWFINDTSMASQKWRLKGHAAEAFWAWVASWSRCVSMPSDIGFDDEGYDLPELIEHIHVVDADRTVDAGDDAGQALLFRMPDMSATGRHKEKRLTLAARAESVAQAVCAEPDEPWVVWVETDAEADALKLFLPAAVEVRGSMQADKKEDRLAAFSEGRARVLITKASIAGFGLNWQHCARMAFAGVSHSYEAYYQAVRRCWRFGQKRRVHVHVAMADTERPIFATVQRKAGDHDAMKGAMRAAMRHASGAVDRHRAYDAAQAMEVPAWLD